MFQSMASAPRMFQSGCVASLSVLIRDPCVCLSFLPLLLLLLPGSCLSCPPSPPFLALVHVLLAFVRCRRFPLLMKPRTLRGCFYPGRFSPGPPPPGCSSPSACLPLMFQSGFHALVRLSFFSFSSLFPSLVLRVLSLHRLLFMPFLLFLAAAASSSSWSPGRSHPGPLRPRMFQSRCVASPVVPVRVPCVRPLLLLRLLPPLPDSFGFTRIGEEERRDGEAIALHKTHIWANSLKPVCFLCFLLIWCPLLPFIETGTLKIYTKMVLYMKNELLTSNTPHGV